MVVDRSGGTGTEQPRDTLRVSSAAASGVVERTGGGFTRTPQDAPDVSSAGGASEMAVVDARGEARAKRPRDDALEGTPAAACSSTAVGSMPDRSRLDAASRPSVFSVNVPPRLPLMFPLPGPIDAGDCVAGAHHGGKRRRCSGGTDIGKSSDGGGGSGSSGSGSIGSDCSGSGGDGSGGGGGGGGDRVGGAGGCSIVGASGFTSGGGSSSWGAGSGDGGSGGDGKHSGGTDGGSSGRCGSGSSRGGGGAFEYPCGARAGAAASDQPESMRKSSAGSVFRRATGSGSDRGSGSERAIGEQSCGARAEAGGGFQSEPAREPSEGLVFPFSEYFVAGTPSIVAPELARAWRERTELDFRRSDVRGLPK